MCRQNDGRQKIAPDLTGLHQTAEQTVETGDGRLGGRGRVAVAQSQCGEVDQSGEVGRLGAPQRSGQRPGSQGSGY